eukprot:CAMPEP_0184866074 /NCGR_PEP_ID=MMETSP0580-20130426/20678_1 /TAXON_ID=1118495 /ORGANISM="Dactyliosolen fragilissimus" /LENGTH=333 /DNA_ID=CAMNT_0027365545 /DNA_START=29 /DNA_END=1030 /DNA_ORIENTATION=-
MSNYVPKVNNIRNTISLALTTNPLVGSRKPRNGDIVKVSWDLKPERDFVPEPLFDADADTEITFVIGDGNYLPALHELLLTMHVGETVTGVEMDAGWGEKRKDLIATIHNSNIGVEQKSKLSVGSELFLSNGMKAKVIEITDEKITIDASPPLAGAKYIASVNLLSIEDQGRFETLTIALGCFWGVELEFMRVPGVVGTIVGYTQGVTANPTYEDVCSGKTNHTEAVQILFDPTIVSYLSLLKIGMSHLGDSKYLLNQVGNDRGTQYRHGIYYHNEEQKQIAMQLIDSYGDDCVTECLCCTHFYTAEQYHQKYLFKGGQTAKKNAKDIIRCYG